jgi:hypothetical protein
MEARKKENRSELGSANSFPWPVSFKFLSLVYSPPPPELDAEPEFPLDHQGAGLVPVKKRIWQCSGWTNFTQTTGVAFHVSEKSLVAWSKLRNKVTSRAGYGIIVDIQILEIRGTYFAD